MLDPATAGNQFYSTMMPDLLRGDQTTTEWNSLNNSILKPMKGLDSNIIMKGTLHITQKKQQLYSKVWHALTLAMNELKLIRTIMLTHCG